MLEFFSNKKTALLGLFLVFAAIGVWVSRSMPVDIFPNLNYPLINVITHYRGGSPKDMELLITRSLESQMSSLLHIRRISCVSREGLSQISVEFNWGTSVTDARQ